MSHKPFQIQPQYGPYRVLSELGRGGQGVVLHARQEALSRDVALKLLFGQGERTRKRFVREAKTLARLRHPNLPNVFDVGEAQGTAYIAMEHVRGVSLKEHVRSRGVPSPEWTRRVLGQVARAVHYCHSNGVLHRDLKPSNILLEAGTERPVLIDFGLITIERGIADADLSFAERTRLSLSGELRGTPHYMSPEQAHPEEGPVTPRSDVYSLGGVLYFLLTGREPFGEKDSIYAVLIGLMQEQPVDPLTYAPQAPADLVAVYRRAMARQPADRFMNAGELADALEVPAAAGGQVSPGVALLLALALGGLGVALPLLALGGREELALGSPSPSATAPAPTPPSELQRPPAPVAPRLEPQLTRTPKPSPDETSLPEIEPGELVLGEAQPTPVAAGQGQPPTWLTTARRGGGLAWERELPGQSSQLRRVGPWTLVERKQAGWFALDAAGKSHPLGPGSAWAWDARSERLLALRGQRVIALDPLRPQGARELTRLSEGSGVKLVADAERVWVGERERLICCDASGQVLWRADHPARVEAPPLPLAPSGERAVLLVDARGVARLLAGETGDELSRLELGAPASWPLVALRSGRGVLAGANGRLALLEVDDSASLREVGSLDLCEPLLGLLVEGPSGQLYATGCSGLYAISAELEVLWHAPPVPEWGLAQHGPLLCDLDGDGRVEVAQAWREGQNRRSVSVYDAGGAELLWIELAKGAQAVAGPQASLISESEAGARRWRAQRLVRPPGGLNPRRTIWLLVAGAWRRAQQECLRLGSPTGSALAALARAHLGDLGPAREQGRPAIDQALSRLMPIVAPPRPTVEQISRLVAPLGGGGMQPPARPLQSPRHVPWRGGPQLGARFPWRQRPIESNGLRCRLTSPFPGRAAPGDVRELRFELEQAAQLRLQISHKATRGQGRQFAELELRLDGEVLIAHLEAPQDVVVDRLDLPELGAGEHVLELVSTPRSLTVHKLDQVVLEPR
ncbi:MAG TPA: hypothetical protein DEA08_05320 [Planctomycetes bacterium]|nr:hypothetical protein [Planctomycetota bacterium]